MMAWGQLNSGGKEKQAKQQMRLWLTATGWTKEDAAEFADDIFREASTTPPPPTINVKEN